MKKLLSTLCILFCCLNIAYASEATDKRISNALKGIERNSSSAVDAITLLASNDAKGITKELKKEALLFLRNNYPYYYKDAISMEKTMYYGNLLNRAFKDDQGRLGWAALKAVKYVYRGHEKISDEATQINLRKVEKALNKLERQMR